VSNFRGFIAAASLKHSKGKGLLAGSHHFRGVIAAASLKRGSDTHFRARERISSASLPRPYRSTPDVMESYALPFASYYAVRASQRGMTAQELYASRRVQFRSGIVGGGQLEQALAGALPKGWVAGDGNTVAELWRGENPAEAVLLGQTVGKLAEAIPGSSGYSHSVSKSALNHIRNNHGDATSEASRGQVGITDADLSAVATIPADYDAMRSDLVSQRGLPVIAYVKQVDDGVLLYLEEVHKKRRDMAALSLWKYLAATDAQQVLRSAVASPNVQNDGGHALNLAPDGQEINQPGIEGQDSDSLQTLQLKNPLVGADAQATRREHAATERAYGGREAYDAAKAAGRTKLNFVQWVQVRTPRFKRWFGDWEAARGVRELAAKGPHDLSEQAALDGKKAIEQAFRSFGPVETADGRSVAFPVGMVGKISRHKGFDVGRVAGAFDALLRDAIPMVSQAEQVREGHKDHSRNVVAYHHYVNRFEQGGREYYVRFTVQSLNARPGAYGQDIAHSSFVSGVDIYSANKKGAAPESTSLRENPVLADGTAPVDRILARWIEAGNGEVSKVTDPDTGEPRVIHGIQDYSGPGMRGHATTMPKALRNKLDTWGLVSQSPYSFSYYDKPGKSWSHTPEGVLRISDHWNFSSGGTMHMRTDVPVEPDMWTLARYEGGTWKVLESLPIEDSSARLEKWFSGIQQVIDHEKSGATALKREKGESAKDFKKRKESSPKHGFFYNSESGQIKSATANVGTFSQDNGNILLQGQPATKAPRGAFSRDSLTITMLQGADLTTVMHEGAHFFFDNDIAMAAEIVAEARITGFDQLKPGERQILSDVSTLFRHHGLQGDIIEQLDQWYRLSPEEQRAHHERTAESFEVYLGTGQAPSVELQPYFRKFRQWFLNFYGSVKRFLENNPEAGKLNDEVRGVFDRMLATNEQIVFAEQARSMIPIFQTAEQAGMRPEEFRAYQALNMGQTEQAAEDLQAKAVQDMRWARNVRSRAIKRLNREARSRMRIEARREVMSQPVYRAWRFLTAKIAAEDRIGKLQDAKSDPNHVMPDRDSLFTAIAKLGGIDQAEARAQWGIDPKANVGAPVFGKAVLRKSGGLSIDSIRDDRHAHRAGGALRPVGALEGAGAAQSARVAAVVTPCSYGRYPSIRWCRMARMRTSWRSGTKRYRAMNPVAPWETTSSRISPWTRRPASGCSPSSAVAEVIARTAAVAAAGFSRRRNSKACSRWSSAHAA